MELSIKQTSVFLLALLCVGITFSGFETWKELNKMAMQDATHSYAKTQIQVNEQVKGIKQPQIQVENQSLPLGYHFDPYAVVEAQDAQDGDISEHVEVFGEVDTNKVGEYQLRYVVRNSFGLKAVKTIKVLVN